MASTFMILVEIATFLLVAFGASYAMRLLDEYLTMRRRLKNAPAADTASPVRPTSNSSLLKTETISNPFLNWVQSASSLNNIDDRSKLRRTLSQAGFDDPTAPVAYVILRFTLAIGLPLLVIVSQTLTPHPLTGFGLIMVTLMFCAVGLLAPNNFVEGRAKARRAQLENEFPDALDLMVVCVEAGLGIESAFVRVGEEVRVSHPRISEEFGRLAQELSAGRSRADALRALADRTNVDTIKSFVALLIQTDSLGAGIGQTLRTYSVEMREHRFLKAEEKAMRIPVLMTVPLVACILPVIIIALLLPAALDVMRVLGPALKGGH